MKLNKKYLILIFLVFCIVILAYFLIRNDRIKEKVSIYKVDTYLEVGEIYDELNIMNALDYEYILDRMNELKLQVSYNEIDTSTNQSIKNKFRDYIVKENKYKNIGVKILTSGTLMTLEDITLLKDLHIMEVGISIYGDTAQVHDRITRSKGSFERSIEVMKQLIKAGIPVSGRMPVMNLNHHSVLSVYKLLVHLGAIPLFDLNITASEDHVRPSEQYRLSQQQITNLLLNRDIRDILFNVDPFESLYCQPTHAHFPLDQPRCGIAQSTIWINAFGDVYPCIQYPDPVGNIKKETLDQIWFHNPLIDQIIEQSRYKHFKKCHTCLGKHYCTPCLGISLQEGRKDRCSDMIESIAMATKTVSDHLKDI